MNTKLKLYFWRLNKSSVYANKILSDHSCTHPVGIRATHPGSTKHSRVQLFPVRQHYDYGSPPRTINDVEDGHHKAEHYTSMDDKFENHCPDG